MNIFFLDDDVEKSASYHVDKHCPKLVVEAAQMMATAYPKGVAPYKATHINHPMSQWVRKSKSNFLYALNYCKALCSEYTFRYDKRHKSENVADWYLNNLPDFQLFDLTDPPRCFGEYVIPITDNVVEDYRNYYKVAKRHLFKWKNREQPQWI